MISAKQGLMLDIYGYVQMQCALCILALCDVQCILCGKVCNKHIHLIIT